MDKLIILLLGVTMLVGCTPNKNTRVYIEVNGVLIETEHKTIDELPTGRLGTRLVNVNGGLIEISTDLLREVNE